MGELILCNQSLAKLPYYLDHAALNIYSLEELGYYVENNLYVIGQEFMNEGLCTWAEQELKLGEMAEKLREILRKQGPLYEFVLCILSETGYCTKTALQQIAKALKEMEQKSEFECCKMRGDRYLESRKYISGIREYRKLLFIKQKNHADPVLTGNIWHNMGTAYARLFLFQEAADCFLQAYGLGQNMESLRECLYAYRCMHDEKGFRKEAEENYLTEEEMHEISSSLSAVSRMEEIRQFEAHLDELFAAVDETEAAGKNGILQLINEWKHEYQKNCII